MTHIDMNALLDRAERRAEGTTWMKRLTLFMQAVTEDRVMQLSLGLAFASLWLTLAFGDFTFLLLLPAAIVAVRRFRRLEQTFAPHDDDWL